MSMKIFRDFRLSRAPEALGRCSTDYPYLLDKCNEAQERLWQTNKNQGFWNSEVPMVFTVTNGYITTPSSVARITNMSVCGMPVQIRNQYWEYLISGVGNQPPNTCQVNCGGPIDAIDRGVVPTLVDIAPTGCTVRVYMTDARDAGKRVLIQGLDQNGLEFRCQDGFTWTLGQYMVLANPFAQLAFNVSKITQILKDTTYGDVPVYQVDIATGAETLLTRLGPFETAPSYRRYYVNNLPANCCNSTPLTQVQGIAKLEFVPCQNDTDLLMIQNISALIAECQSIRYGDMETPESERLAVIKHREAIRLLNNELDHRTDRNKPAVGVNLNEKRSLQRAGVGLVI